MRFQYTKERQISEGSQKRLNLNLFEYDMVRFGFISPDDIRQRLGLIVRRGKLTNCWQIQFGISMRAV